MYDSQYNTTLLPSVNTLIARGMFCGVKYTHHTFTPVIKHLITTRANKHPRKTSFIDNNCNSAPYTSYHGLKTGPNKPCLTAEML